MNYHPTAAAPHATPPGGALALWWLFRAPVLVDTATIGPLGMGSVSCGMPVFGPKFLDGPSWNASAFGPGSTWSAVPPAQPLDPALKKLLLYSSGILVGMFVRHGFLQPAMF